MATRRSLVTDGVLVQLRAGCYWRNRATGAVFTGPSGRPGTTKYREGSGPFRIPAPLWARQESLSAAERIFQAVGNTDESTD